MPFQLKKVAIIGASGNIGKIILSSLIESSIFTITVLARKESDAQFPASVTVRKTDFSATELEEVLKGQDAVISTVGATAFGEQKKFIDAAVRAGVKLFIPSEFSASIQSEGVLKLLPLFGQKKEVVEYLKTKESAGLTWTGVAVSGLFDWGPTNGFLEFDIPNRTATIWDGGDKTFTLTNEKQLGQAVIAVLQSPEKVKNQYIHIASVETTQKEILTSLESATGVKWAVSETTTDAQVSEAVKKLGAGDFSGAFALVRATCFGNTPGLKANYVKDVGVVNDVLGLELEGIEDTVRRVVGK